MFGYKTIEPSDFVNGDRVDMKSLRMISKTWLTLNLLDSGQRLASASWDW